MDADLITEDTENTERRRDREGERWIGMENSGRGETGTSLLPVAGICLQWYGIDKLQVE
jgi:hypothetical protein